MLYTASAFAYFIVATSISYAFYKSFYLNTAYIIYITYVAAKNGASYYFGYFARRYESEMQKLEQIEKEIK